MSAVSPFRTRVRTCPSQDAVDEVSLPMVLDSVHLFLLREHFYAHQAQFRFGFAAGNCCTLYGDCEQGSSLGMSWISVPPRKTFMLCKKSIRTGRARLNLTWARSSFTNRNLIRLTATSSRGAQPFRCKDLKKKSRCSGRCGSGRKFR